MNGIKKNMNKGGQPKILVPCEVYQRVVGYY